MTLIEAIGELPKNERRVVTLRKVYDFNQRQIAERLRISEDEVERVLVRAMRHMLELMPELAADDDRKVKQ